MNTTLQNLLAAGAGFIMADGTQYRADSNGEITSGNATHIAFLIGLGFVDTGAVPAGGSVSVTPPVSGNGTSGSPLSLSNLNHTDAVAIATAFFTAITAGLNVTWGGGHSEMSVATGPTAIYCSALLTGITLTSTFSSFVVPISTAAHASIGAANVVLLSGGADDTSTGVTLPTEFNNGVTSWNVYVSGTPSEAVEVSVNAILQLQ